LKFRIESNSFCRSQTDYLSPFLATVVVRNGDNFGLSTVAVLATVAAKNGIYRRQRQQQFVAFLATIVAVVVAKNGIVEKA